MLIFRIIAILVEVLAVLRQVLAVLAVAQLIVIVEEGVAVLQVQHARQLLTGVLHQFLVVLNCLGIVRSVRGVGLVCPGVLSFLPERG